MIPGISYKNIADKETSMDMSNAQLNLIKDNKFDVRFKQSSSMFGFKRGHYEIYCDNKQIGTIGDDPVLAQLCKDFLNAAYKLGAGSGMAQASVYGEEPRNYSPPPKAYAAVVYDGNDDYDYSITFEESPIRHLKNINAKALNNMINAFNYAYTDGFNNGIDSVLSVQDNSMSTTL